MENNKTINIKRNKYRNDFNKKTYSSVIIRFKKDDQHDMNLLKHIKKQKNINSYIKNLIKKDI